MGERTSLESRRDPGVGPCTPAYGCHHGRSGRSTPPRSSTLTASTWCSWTTLRSNPNRDPAMFPDADKVVIDRKENRHAAFGLGIHRCVGSNLARMEMTVAIEEWLKRIPDFRLDPAGRVTWSEGTVRGPRQLPMLFGKAN